MRALIIATLEMQASRKCQDGVWQQERAAAEAQPSAVVQRLRATQQARAA